MYCEKCGAEIDDSAAFCEKCGAEIQSVNYSSSPPSESPIDGQMQNESIIYVGEKAVAYYKVLIIRIVVILILSIIAYIGIFSIKGFFNSLIAEIDAKYNGYGYYYHQIEDEGVRTLRTFNNIFSFLIPVLIILNIISFVKFFINLKMVNNTRLFLTNVGIVGSTGKPFDTPVLEAHFSDILHAEVRGCKNEYGWLVINTLWGTEYTFLLANPSSFLHYLNEQRKNNS